MTVTSQSGGAARRRRVRTLRTFATKASEGPGGLLQRRPGAQTRLEPGSDCPAARTCGTGKDLQVPAQKLGLCCASPRWGHICDPRTVAGTIVKTPLAPVSTECGSLRPRDLLQETLSRFYGGRKVTERGGKNPAGKNQDLLYPTVWCCPLGQHLERKENSQQSQDLAASSSSGRRQGRQPGLLREAQRQ